MTTEPRCSAGATLTVAITLAAAIALPGCLPEARITWSPDGAYALLRGAAKLYLCHADGKLIAVPQANAAGVEAVAWMPDGRQFLTVRAVPAATWEELRAHMTATHANNVVAQAEEFRRQVLAYKGNWGEFNFQCQPDDIVAALMCLRDRHGRELAPIVGPAWEGLKNLEHRVRHVELLAVADGQVRHVREVVEWLGPIAEIRVAPTGKAFAFAGQPYPPSSPAPEMALYVGSLAGPGGPSSGPASAPSSAPSSAPATAPAATATAPAANPDKVVMVTAPGVSLFFDWTREGTSLVYAAPNREEPGFQMPAVQLDTQEGALTYARGRVRNRGAQDPLRAGSIHRCPVATPEGAILKEFKERTTLATAFYIDSQPVRCLEDGRVLFAALDVRLPAPPAEVARTLSLFRISRIEPVTITALLTPKAQEELGRELDLMQLSPDGARICVPANGAVKVADLAGGKVVATYGPDKHLAQQVIPVWRTSEQVCFIVRAGAALGSPGRPEVVLCSPTATGCLSKDWPNGLVEDLLARGR